MSIVSCASDRHRWLALSARSQACRSSPVAMRIAVALWDRWNEDEHCSRPGNQFLAEFAAVDVKRVRAALRDLEHEGLISRPDAEHRQAPGRGHAVVIRLLLPAQGRGVTSTPPSDDKGDVHDPPYTADNGGHESLPSGIRVGHGREASSDQKGGPGREASGGKGGGWSPERGVTATPPTSENIEEKSERRARARGDDDQDGWLHDTLLSLNCPRGPKALAEHRAMLDRLLPGTGPKERRRFLEFAHEQGGRRGDPPQYAERFAPFAVAWREWGRDEYLRAKTADPQETTA